MSSTSSPETFGDLYKDLLDRCREDKTRTEVIEQAKRRINTALLDMHISYAENFPWAERDAALITHPTYTDGTVTTVQGIAIFGGLGTLWATSDGVHNNVRVGGKMLVSGSSNPYEVSAVASNGGITTTEIVIETGASGLSYTYYEDEYDLASDFLRPVDQRSFSDDMPIRVLGRVDFRRRYPVGTSFGRPHTCTFIDRATPGPSNATPVRRVRLYPTPSERISLRYSYITKNLVVSSANAAQEAFSADDDQPIVPKRYRHIIVLHALAEWYRDKKDDARSQEAMQQYVDGVQRAVGDVEVGAQMPNIRPRLGPWRRKAGRPWSGSRYYDVGGRFDRMED